MKILNLRKNSIHFRLAKFGGFNSYSSQDFCTYLKKVTVGTSKLAGWIFGIIIASASAGNFLAWLLVSIKFGTIHIPQDALSILFTVVLMAIVISAICGLLLLCIVFAMHIAVNAKFDSFIPEAYRTLKNKTCVKVTFRN